MAEQHEAGLIGSPNEQPFFALQPAQRRSTALMLLVAGLVLALGSAPLAGSGWFLTVFLGVLAAAALAATVVARRTAGVAFLVAAGIFGLLAAGNVLRADSPDESATQTQPTREVPAAIPTTSASPTPTQSASPTASPTPSPVPEKVLDQTELTLKPHQRDSPFDGLHVLADDWTGSLILKTREESCSFTNLPERVEQAFVLASVKQSTWYRVTVTEVNGRASYSIRDFTVDVELVRSSAAPAGTLLENC